MTPAQLLRLRLHQQKLSHQANEGPGDVVRWLGAVQAQDYFGSLWSVGQRLKKSSEQTIERALKNKDIVRSWPMRGTLHFTAPEDLRWMLKYLTPRVIKRTEGLYKKAELTKQVFSKCGKIVEKSLQGGQQLTRDELYEILEKQKIETKNTRGLFILGYLAQQGLICFGARNGKQHTFTLLDEWIPLSRIPPKDEALANLAQRYFTSHGPATLDDFTWWSGLTKAEATGALEDVRSRLSSATIGVKTFWFAAGQGIPGRKASTAWLLPTYDEFVIAYKDRTEIISRSDHEKVGGLFTSPIVVGGNIIGSWRRVFVKDNPLIETRALRPFTAGQKKAIIQAAKRYGKFLGVPEKIKF